MKLYTKFLLVTLGLLSAVSGSAASLTALVRPAVVRHIAVVAPATLSAPQKAVAATQQLLATVSLVAYPNPSQGIVTFNLTETQVGADYKLRLRNIIGQEVRTVALRPELMQGVGLRLDWSELPAGLYFYSLLVDNKAVLTKRLTLQ